MSTLLAGRWDRRWGRGLATHPHMLRLRKWKRKHFIPTIDSLHACFLQQGNVIGLTKFVLDMAGTKYKRYLTILHYYYWVFLKLHPISFLGFISILKILLFLDVFPLHAVSMSCQIPSRRSTSLSLRMWTWWRLGWYDHFQPEGHGFDSRSSHQVGTLGKSFTCSCLCASAWNSDTVSVL